MSWLSNLFRKKSDSTQTQVASKSTEESDLKLSFNVSISSYNVESFLAKGFRVSSVKLGGYRSQSGGYVNWNRYQVRGVKIGTGRQNKRYFDAKCEEEAIDLAKASGLSEPFEVKIKPHELPTERQLEYLKSWNVPLPKDATKYDVSAILSRLEDSRDIISSDRVSDDLEIRYVLPAPGPSEGFAAFADFAGVKFSKYVGLSTLLYKTLEILDIHEKAAFYAYCVLCADSGTEIGDLRKAKLKDQIYRFADTAIQDVKLSQSILNRLPNDYLHPHKGTSAYKAVASFFKLQ